MLKMKKTAKRSRKVEEILYSKFKGNQATRYGTNMEDTARQQYVTYQNQKGRMGLGTHRVGLVISVDNPWLAASPDDKVYDPNAAQSLGVAEYKNPYIHCKRSHSSGGLRHHQNVLFGEARGE